MGPRLGALFVDWLIAYGVAGLAHALDLVGAGALSTAILVIWMLLGAVSVRLFGFSPGQLTLRLKVASVDYRENVGVGRALVRVLMVALVVPPLFTDTDGRGLHDRVTGTAVVRK